MHAPRKFCEIVSIYSASHCITPSWYGGEAAVKQLA